MKENIKELARLFKDSKEKGLSRSEVEIAITSDARLSRIVVTQCTIVLGGILFVLTLALAGIFAAFGLSYVITLCVLTLLNIVVSLSFRRKSLKIYELKRTELNKEK